MQPCISIATLGLDQIVTGEHVALLNIHNSRGIVSRLTSLGFTPGVDIEMIQNYGYGPLVVSVRGTRVALGRREAKKTLVQRSESK